MGFISKNHDCNLSRGPLGDDTRDGKAFTDPWNDDRNLRSSKLEESWLERVATLKRVVLDISDRDYFYWIFYCQPFSVYLFLCSQRNVFPSFFYPSVWAPCAIWLKHWYLLYISKVIYKYRTSCIFIIYL